jgi:hypothetical protein
MGLRNVSIYVFHRQGKTKNLFNNFATKQCVTTLVNITQKYELS